MIYSDFTSKTLPEQRRGLSKNIPKYDTALDHSLIELRAIELRAAERAKRLADQQAMKTEVTGHLQTIAVRGGRDEIRKFSASIGQDRFNKGLPSTATPDDLKKLRDSLRAYEEQAEVTDSLTIAQDVDTSLFTHFAGGIPDVWLGQLRKLSKHGAILFHYWNNAIKAGLHPMHAPISAGKLGDYMVRSGYAGNIRQAVDLARNGLDSLARIGVLSVNKDSESANKTPYCYPTPCDQIIDLMLAQADPDFDQIFYPGLQTKLDDPDPLACKLKSVHFESEGFDQDTAAQLAESINARLPIQDTLLTRRASRKKTQALNALRESLENDQTVTPLAAVKIVTYSDFDAARYRGRVENSPNCQVDDFSRDQWADFLGVATSALPGLRTRAGLITELQTGIMPVLIGSPIKTQIRAFTKQHHGKPIKLAYVDPNTGESGRDAYTLEKIQRHISARHATSVIFSLRSITKLAPTVESSLDQADQHVESTPDQKPTKEAGNLPVADKTPKAQRPRRSWLWRQLALRIVLAGASRDQVMQLTLDQLIGVCTGKIRLFSINADQFLTERLEEREAA